MPPPGDIAHAYAFYIFKSDASFSPPPVGSPFSQALVNQGMNRFSFNVDNFAAEKGIGPLVGATYLLAQNKSGSASASASGSGTGSVSTPTAAPFLGGSSRYSLGLTGGVVVLTAIILASLLAA